MKGNHKPNTSEGKNRKEEPPQLPKNHARKLPSQSTHNKIEKVMQKTINKTPFAFNEIECPFVLTCKMLENYAI